MSRALNARLRKLEHNQPKRMGKWHQVIGDSNEELDAKMAAIMASPEWTEGDHFIARLIVDPPQRRLS